MNRTNKRRRFYHCLGISQDLQFRLRCFISLVFIVGIVCTCVRPSRVIAAPLLSGQQTVLVSLNSHGDSRMPAESNKEIALHFAQEGWGTKPNWKKTWDELMVSDVIYHFNSSSEAVVGLEANKEFNADLFKGFPDLHQTIEDVVAEDNTVVYRTTLEGTNAGEFLGTAPTGKPVKINDFTLLRFSEGRISEWWYECNLLEVMQQLGFISEMGT